MSEGRKQRMNAREVFFKTMPFVWAKLLLGIITVVASVIILAILLGIAWLFNSAGVGLVMVIIWLALTTLPLVLNDVRNSFEIKAVLTL